MMFLIFIDFEQKFNTKKRISIGKKIKKLWSKTESKLPTKQLKEKKNLKHPASKTCDY